jgi:cyclase
VVVLDVKKTGILKNYSVHTLNATRDTSVGPVDFARRAEALGAGEIVINSVDQDGLMKGYDMALVDDIRQAVSLPVTVLGGAGSLADIEALIRRYRIIGSAAGSLFVFKGKYRAVLINYPNREEKDALVERALTAVG